MYMYMYIYKYLYIYKYSYIYMSIYLWIFLYTYVPTSIHPSIYLLYCILSYLILSYPSYPIPVHPIPSIYLSITPSPIYIFLWKGKNLLLPGEFSRGYVQKLGRSVRICDRMCTSTMGAWGWQGAKVMAFKGFLIWCLEQ